jgi:hypothetical protein
VDTKVTGDDLTHVLVARDGSTDEGLLAERALSLVAASLLDTLPAEMMEAWQGARLREGVQANRALQLLPEPRYLLR